MSLGRDLDQWAAPTVSLVSLSVGIEQDLAALHVELRHVRGRDAVEPCDFDGWDARFQLCVHRVADVVRVAVVAAAGHYVVVCY